METVESYHFIRVRNVSGVRDESVDSGVFECLQGYFPGENDGGGTSGGTISLYGNLDITDALWTAQSNAITNQIAQLDLLQEQLGEDAAGNTGITGIMKNFGAWVLNEVFLKQLLSEAIEKMIPPLDILGGEIWDDVCDTIAEAVVDLITYVIDFFEKKASPGVKQCLAMKEENTALLTLTKSPETYYLRKETLDAHQVAINELYSQLSQADEKFMALVQMLVDLLKGYIAGDSTEEEDGWDTVLTTMTDKIDNLDEWLDQVETQDESDLPVPVPPEFPAIPSGDKNVSRKMAYLIAKFGIKFMMENYRKQRQNDVAFTDLVEAVNDLKFNGVRIHTSNGDVIELTGVGTFAESYNQ